MFRAALMALGLLTSCGNEADVEESEFAEVQEALQSNFSVSIRVETLEANIIKPRLAITNLGTQALSNFALHFYFTVESGKTPVLENYYTPLSSEVLVSLNSVSAGLYRLEYRYTGQTLAPGDTLPEPAGSVVGLHYADWSTWDRVNDYSMLGVGLGFTETDRVVVVDGAGNIVYGTPPPGAPSRSRSC